MYEVRPIQKNVLIKDYNIIIRSLRSKLYFSLFCLFVCVQSLCICIKPMENHNFKIQLAQNPILCIFKDFHLLNKPTKIGQKCASFSCRAPSKLEFLKKFPSSRSQITPHPIKERHQFLCIARHLPIFAWVTPKMCEQNV